MTYLATFFNNLVGTEKAEVAAAMRALNSKVVRGHAQGMRSSFGSFSGSGNWSLKNRTGHRSKKAFARSRAIITLVYQPIAPFVDVELPNSYNFEVGIEPNFLESLTGLAASPKFMYNIGGATVLSYAGPGSTREVYIITDWLYHTTIAADQKHGLWMITQNALGASSPAGTIPLDNQGGSSYINRNEGFSFTSTDQLGSIQTTDSLTAFSSAQLGGSPCFTPSSILIDYDTTDKVVAIDGDSIPTGVGEANTGSPTTSDILGNVSRNAGFIARGVHEYLNLNSCINLSKASDGGKYKALPSAVRGRMQLFRVTNPTHLIVKDLTNDFTGTGSSTTTTYAASKSYYSRGDTVASGGNLYLCVRGGISGASSPPTGTAAFTEVADNSVRWVYLLPDTTAGRQAATAYGHYLIQFDEYRAAQPSVKITVSLAPPDSTSADGGLTQTPSYPVGTGVRDLLHSLFRRASTDSTLGVVAFYDPWAQVEYNDGSGTRTGLWSTGPDNTVAIASGTAYYYSQDLRHPNSRGHDKIASGFTSALVP